jgi:hypothetical protein
MSSAGKFVGAVGAAQRTTEQVNNPTSGATTERIGSSNTSLSCPRRPPIAGLVTSASRVRSHEAPSCTSNGVTNARCGRWT